MAHSTETQLRALLETDRTTFAEQLGTHAWFESMLVPFIPTLRADPELAAATRAHVESYRLADFDKWMRRRILPLTVLDMARFCELANELAHARDPEFPSLSPVGSQYVDTWYCGGEKRHDAREHGRGWVFRVVEQDVGPAEVIHEEQWSADAHGDGWVISVRLDSSNSTVHVWEEPDEPPQTES